MAVILVFPASVYSQTSASTVVGTVAAEENLPLLTPDQIPSQGTFWLVMSNPRGTIATVPLPWPPLGSGGSFNVYAITWNEFLVDETTNDASTTSTNAIAAQAIQILNIIDQVQTAENPPVRKMGMAMAIPFPGGLGANGDSGNYLTNEINYTWDTNQLWLQITNVTSDLAFANLYHATNQVYAIWSSADLVSWQVESEVWPANTNCQPFTVSALNRPDLYLRAEDWTEVTENGNTTPDWWFWMYFGTTDLSDTNLDGQGNMLLSDYQNGADPTTISFNVQLGNQHFNTTNATGSYLVTGGIPSYAAVLVGTNFNDAVWSNYDGTVYLQLPPIDGVYQVWIGLKGYATNATPAWIGTDVYLDRVPPVVSITNPVSGIATTPYVQVQGFANEELLSVTYDLSNAVTVITNQRAYQTGYFIDTNLMAYTTNYFQCYDLRLTNGVNGVTVHCTDLAGNVTTTNFTLTLDYSMATNPVLNLTWPQNGLEICQTNFTLRGWTEDCSAQVVAQIVDTNGDTNVVNGFVERTGVMWVQNLPLAEGTNWLTVWVTNSAGLSSMTNISLVKNDMVLTLDNVNGDLWLPTVSVSGSISDTSAAVWVNGVQGTNYGNGSWSADNVPVSAGGVASFDVTADPTNSADPDMSQQDGKPTEYLTASAIWGDNYREYTDVNPDGTFGPAFDIQTLNGTWSAAKGGMVTSIYKTYDTNGVLDYASEIDETVAPDLEITLLQNLTNGMTFFNQTNIGSLSLQYNSGSWSFPLDASTLEDNTFSQLKVMLNVGGFQVAGQQALAMVTASAAAAFPPPGNNNPLPPDQISIPGLGKNLQANGWAISVTSVGSSMDITPKVSLPYYTFGVSGGASVPTHQTAVPALADPNLARLNLGVGESVNLGLPLPSSPLTYGWSTTAGGVAGNTFTAPSNAASATISAEVTNGNDVVAVPLPAFQVFEPSGYVDADILATTNAAYGLTPLAVGNPGAQMFLIFYIGPLNVCLSRVSFAEAGSDATDIHGYFTNTNLFSSNPALALSHDPGEGWRTLGSDNAAYDLCNRVSDFPGPWSSGGFTWNIPVSWKIGDGPTNSMPGWSQVFTFTSDGTVAISKFGQTVIRGTNGVTIPSK